MNERSFFTGNLFWQICLSSLKPTVDDAQKKLPRKASIGARRQPIIISYGLDSCSERTGVSIFSNHMIQLVSLFLPPPTISDSPKSIQSHSLFIGSTRRWAIGFKEHPLCEIPAIVARSPRQFTIYLHQRRRVA